MNSWPTRLFLLIVISLPFIPGKTQSLTSDSLRRNSPYVVSFSEDTDNSAVDDADKAASVKLNMRQGPKTPIVINTWNFTEANAKAWEVLSAGGSALDSVDAGATECEMLQCGTTVGYGGSPDENGETTLDAMIMDGETHSVGAVGCLRRVKNAVGVARKVMEHTKHTLLVGELATDFALKMGFPEENLTTDVSTGMHQNWTSQNCQPNFWRNVYPDPTVSCGPYHIDPSKTVKLAVTSTRAIDQFNHDTIGMVSIDSQGKIAAATSSNGARHKIPGRVGDAPIVGAGNYVEKDVGGAAATGDGDIMVRFLPSLLAVEKMSRGLSPTEAAREAMSKIARFYPDYQGALVAVNIQGEYGAACHNLEEFPYSVANIETGTTIVETVSCPKISAAKLP